MKKLKPYREIINGDKVIIANRDTGSWIRISRQCMEIRQHLNVSIHIQRMITGSYNIL